MNTQRKIVIVGAGSLKSLEVAASAALMAAEQKIKVHVVLMDLNVEKVRILAALAPRMPEYDPAHVQVTAADTFEQAVDGADAVYSLISVNPPAYGRDSGTCGRAGLHGDDTYGPSAAMLAIRNGRVLLKLAVQMEKRCPDAWFCIFTNPVTINTDVLWRNTRIKTMGLCAGAENFERDFDHFHGDPPEIIQGLTWNGGGLNHFSWVSRESTFRGEPVADYLRRHLAGLDHKAYCKKVPEALWDLERPVFEFTGQMPMNNGHFYHYFLWDVLLKSRERGRKAWQRTYASGKTPPSPPDPWVLLRQAAAGSGKMPDFWTALPLEYRDVKRPNLGVRSLFSIWHHLGWRVPVNIPNNGHVRDMPQGAVVEVTCRMTAKGPEPLGLDPLPPMLKGLMPAVAYQQRMVADLVIHPSRQALKESIFADPCHRSLSAIHAVADEMWEAFEKDEASR